MSRIDRLIKDLGGDREAVRRLALIPGTKTEIKSQIRRIFQPGVVVRISENGFSIVDLAKG